MNNKKIKSPGRRKFLKNLALTGSGFTIFPSLSFSIFSPFGTGANENYLEQVFDNPPVEAQLRAYWWWVNGNVTREAITRDLEEMKAKGFGGAVLCDMDRSYIRNRQVPHGPNFMSDEWRALYKHTLREANRLTLEISLNITSGWALGGPMIKPEDTVKKLVWIKQNVKGPSVFNKKLEEPAGNLVYGEPYRSHETVNEEKGRKFYRDIVTIAYPKSKTDPINNWEFKALHKPLHHSAPDSGLLLENLPSAADQKGIKKDEVIDLSDKVSADGTLHWEVPEGEWEILRLGYTIADDAVLKTSSEGWPGYALDVFDAKVFEDYWEAVVHPLIEDAGNLAGDTLKYLHSDSWEVEPLNWTSTYRQEFRERRGYDMFPFIPVLTGDVIGNWETSNRFLHDFRKTFGELVIDNHYKILREKAHDHNLLIHPESGGPHAVPIDAQQNLGFNDIPMSEFWAKSWTHRVEDKDRFFVKQPASAAHTYGHRIVMAEGFTTLGPHWQETIWDNLKPSFDKAACEGLNLLVWHAFSCSPKEMGIPGQDSHAGTHFNPNVTWWSRSEAFLSYINRCQTMLQHGLFAADVLYYYGDHVPNFSQLKSSDPANILPGYDYDVVTEEVMLERADVKDGRIVLPDGMSYRLLVLPDHAGFSLPVLKKIKVLLKKGAVIAGSKPRYMNGLSGYEAGDQEFRTLVDELWGNDSDQVTTERKIGKGRLISGVKTRKILTNQGIEPDFSFSSSNEEADIDYIHRANPSADIFFISNQSDAFENLQCRFRITGKQPEFWDAVTGKRWQAADWTVDDGQTVLPVELPPYGSLFVVFRDKATPSTTKTGKSNFLTFSQLQEIKGDWKVVFDPQWGGPSKPVVFRNLVSWTEHANPGIKYYSGTATYVKQFDPQFDLSGESKKKYYIDLGNVRELAEIRLNGEDLGITWSPPFRVEITNALIPHTNELEIDVVNFWPNRIIGDHFLPEHERYTQTNIEEITGETPLSVSGLLGPVRILESG